MTHDLSKEKTSLRFNQNTITIRPSQLSDIDVMVSLSKAKRLNYEKAQPQFWRYAGAKGDESQRQWFLELLQDKDYLMFTAISKDQEIIGFIIGRFIKAPEVYNPGGMTLMIDDFCVESKLLWESVGNKLVEVIKFEAKSRGATQIVVVCGAHDNSKRKFLIDKNLSIASEWFVGNIND
jgi:hypothetical protein